MDDRHHQRVESKNNIAILDPSSFRILSLFGPAVDHHNPKTATELAQKSCIRRGANIGLKMQTFLQLMQWSKPLHFLRRIPGHRMLRVDALEKHLI